MFPTIDETLVVMKRGKGEHAEAGGEAGGDTKEGAAEDAALQALSESQRCVAFMDALYETLVGMGKDDAAKTGTGAEGTDGNEGQEKHQVAMDQMKYYVRSSSSFVHVPVHIPRLPFCCRRSVIGVVCSGRG